MSLDFLSKGQPWLVLEHGHAILFLSAYSISPISNSKDTLGIGFGLRKNGPVRFYNLKSKTTILKAKLGGVS